MSCFDSFYIYDIEIQTKQLTCNMNTYRLGDTVITDDESSSFYLIEQDDEIGYVGLIIVNGVFVHYVAKSTEESCRYITEWGFNYHTKHSNSTVRMFANLIKDNINPRLYTAEKKLHKIQQATATYEAYIKDPDSDSIFSFLEYWDNFKNGESLADVIKNIMKESDDNSKR
jgi:hypothetical protein